MKNYLSMNNTKLKRDGIAVFGIPAYKAQDGMLTCPAAKDCIKGCYARQGTFTWSNVNQAYENRLELTKQINFVDTIVNELDRRKTIKIVRIHDSGDFYNKEYLNKWLEIINKKPNIRFYAYTKMIPLFLGLKLPKNFTVIYSYGGKFDSEIDTSKDRHSKVFNSLSELKKHKYSDVTTNDIKAMGKSNKIGLVYHGAKSKAWTA